MEATFISKEQLLYCNFQPANSNEKIMEQLNSAMILGNNFKGKCRIYFNTLDGMKAVETTVWSVAEKFVLLKGDIIIPVNCIAKVEF